MPLLWSQTASSQPAIALRMHGLPLTTDTLEIPANVKFNVSDRPGSCENGSCGRRHHCSRVPELLWTASGFDGLAALQDVAVQGLLIDTAVHSGRGDSSARALLLFQVSASERRGKEAGPGTSAGGYPIGKGCDLFISVWNLHRSPHLWRDPDDFRPSRFSEDFANHDFQGAWAGYRHPPPPPPPFPPLCLTATAAAPLEGPPQGSFSHRSSSRQQPRHRWRLALTTEPGNLQRRRRCQLAQQPHPWWSHRMLQSLATWRLWLPTIAGGRGRLVRPSMLGWRASTAACRICSRLPCMPAGARGPAAGPAEPLSSSLAVLRVSRRDACIVSPAPISPSAPAMPR